MNHSEPIGRVDSARLDEVVAAAQASPRLRMNDNLHAMEDPVHRLLNAIEPDSYVRPHRHATPPKPETLTVLRGRGATVMFDDDGNITRVDVLSPDGPTLVVDLPAAKFHTLVSLEPGTVWFEVKEGPYAAPPPEDFASWAPAPDSEGTAAYLESLHAAIAERGQS